MRAGRSGGRPSRARSLGRADYLVGAAIGIAMLSEAGKVDHKLVALIDEALAAIGPERTAARASLLSAKSQELYWIDAQGESKRLVEEAIEIAREVDAPTTLSAALHRQIFVPFGPDSQQERLGDRRRDARARQEHRRRRERPPRPRLPDDGLPRARRHRRLRPRVRGVLRALRPAADAPVHLAEDGRGRACGRCSTATWPRPRGSPRRRVKAGRPRRAAARLPVLRRAADPDPRPAGPLGRAASGGARARRALPRDPRLAHGPRPPRGSLGRLRAGAPRARALRPRRLLGDPARRELARGDVPGRRADGDARRRRALRVDLRGAAPLRGPDRGGRAAPAAAAGRSTASSGCSRARWAARPTRSATSARRSTSARRMGDVPALAVARADLAELLLRPRRARAGARAAHRERSRRPGRWAPAAWSIGPSR